MQGACSGLASCVVHVSSSKLESNQTRSPSETGLHTGFGPAQNLGVRFRVWGGVFDVRGFVKVLQLSFNFAQDRQACKPLREAHRINPPPPPFCSVSPSSSKISTPTEFFRPASSCLKLGDGSKAIALSPKAQISENRNVRTSHPTFNL